MDTPASPEMQLSPEPQMAYTADGIAHVPLRHQAIPTSDHLAQMQMARASRGEYQMLVQRHISAVPPPAPPDDPVPARGLEAENARLRMEVNELRTVLAKCEPSKASMPLSPAPMTPEIDAYVSTGSSMAGGPASLRSSSSATQLQQRDNAAGTVVKPVLLAPTVEKMRLHDLEEHRRLLAARVIQRVARDRAARKRAKRGQRRSDDEATAALRAKKPAGAKSMGQMALAARTAAKNVTAPKTDAGPSAADREVKEKRAPPRTSRYVMGASTFVPGKVRDNDIATGRLERFIGTPPALVFNAMEREHASDTVFSSFSIEDTTPRAEWLYVLAGAVGSRPDRVHDCTPERVGWRLEDFVLSDTARRASLTREEVIAIRLYTGPMSEWYNATLRGKRKDEFTATIHAMNSAIVKLSKLQRAATVFRLVTIIKPPDEFFAVDAESGSCSGFEAGFLSTTSRRTVAMRLSETRTNITQKPAKGLRAAAKAAAAAAASDVSAKTVLLRLRVVPYDQAGDVSFASQVPAEGECVFAPLTTLEVVSYYQENDADGTIVADVRTRRSHTAKTTEQTIGKMKVTHVDLVDTMLDELKAAGAPEPSLLPLVCLQMERTSDDATSQYNLADKYAEYTSVALEKQQRVLRNLSNEAEWAKAAGKDNIFNRMVGVVALQAQAGEFEAAIELTKLAFKRSALPEELAKELEWAEKWAVGHLTNTLLSVVKPSEVRKMYPPPVHFVLEATIYFLSLGATQPWPPLMAALLNKLTPAGHTAFGEFMRITIERQRRVINTNVLVWNEKTRRWQQGVASADGNLVRIGQEERHARSITKWLYPVDAGIGAFFNAAAAYGDATLVNTLLEARATLLFCDERANSSLHLATMGGHADVCRRLLKAGADMRMPNIDGLSAWDLALRASTRAVTAVLNPSAVDLDIEGGATPASTVSSHLHEKDYVKDLLRFAIAADKDKIKKVIEAATGSLGGMQTFVDTPNKDGVTALMFASGARSPDAYLTARILIERGASPIATSRRGCTALMFGAVAGQVATVNSLLHKNAVVDQKCEGGYTALHLAIENGHPDVAASLVTAGANVDTRLDNGWSCLMTAAHCGNVGVLQHLIEKPVDANVIFTPPGEGKGAPSFAPIHLAAYHGFAGTLAELIRLGANVDQPMKNGWNALMTAAAKGHKAACEALLRSGADVDYQGAVDGMSPLMAAASNPFDASCVGLLLQAQASVNLCDGKGVQALMFASRLGHSSAVSQLLRQRANVKHTRPGGATALLDAAAAGSHAVVRLLLTAGADAGSADENGQTALMHAAKAGHEETMLPLLIVGSDVTAVDSSSRSALALAPTKQVARRLLEAGADVNHLPEAFYGELGLSMSDGLQKTGPKGGPADGKAAHGKANGARGTLGGGSGTQRGSPPGKAGPSPPKAALSDRRGASSRRQEGAGKSSGGAVDLFYVPPPDMSGRGGKEPTSGAKPLLADDPIEDLSITALGALNVEPPHIDEMPLLQLNNESCDSVMCGAIMHIQRAFRQLKRREKLASRQAFYKPKGSQGVKTSGFLAAAVARHEKRAAGL